MTPASGKSLRVWLPALRAGSGSDVFTMRLAEALARAGHDPVLQWFDHRHEFYPGWLRTVKPPPRVDIVHTGSALGHVFARSGLPLVVTEHHFVLDPAFLPLRSTTQALYHRLTLIPALKASLSRADVVTAVSAHTAMAMSRVLGVAPRVIPNWIDVDRFHPRDDVARASEGPLRLLFVGNPSRRKGADVIPSLAMRLGPRFEVLCLGGLRRRFANGSSPAGVTLLDRVAPDDMPLLYREVDAVLVPTRYEAFGYVALEAMACGLPVIGFDSTGTAEVCVNGETAWLSPVDDLDALEANVRRLESRALREALGVAGRRRAVTLFSEAPAVDAYVDAYRHAIALRGDISSR